MPEQLTDLIHKALAAGGGTEEERVAAAALSRVSADLAGEAISSLPTGSFGDDQVVLAAALGVTAAAGTDYTTMFGFVPQDLRLCGTPAAVAAYLAAWRRPEHGKESGARADEIALAHGRVDRSVVDGCAALALDSANGRSDTPRCVLESAYPSSVVDVMYAVAWRCGLGLAERDSGELSPEPFVTIGELAALVTPAAVRGGASLWRCGWGELSAQEVAARIDSLDDGGLRTALTLVADTAGLGIAEAVEAAQLLTRSR